MICYGANVVGIEGDNHAITRAQLLQQQLCVQTLRRVFNLWEVQTLQRVYSRQRRVVAAETALSILLVKKAVRFWKKTVALRTRLERRSVVFQARLLEVIAHWRSVTSLSTHHDHVSLLVANFHFIVSFSSTTSSGFLEDGARKTRGGHSRITHLGRKRLTRASALGICGFVSWIAGHQCLAIDQATDQPSFFIPRENYPVLTASYSSWFEKRASHSPGLPVTTFLNVVRLLYKPHSSPHATAPHPNELRSLLPLDLIVVAWPVHKGKLWNRRWAVASLVRTAFLKARIDWWHKHAAQRGVLKQRTLVFSLRRWGRKVRERDAARKRLWQLAVTLQQDIATRGVKRCWDQWRVSLRLALQIGETTRRASFLAMQRQWAYGFYVWRCAVAFRRTLRSREQYGIRCFVGRKWTIATGFRHWRQYVHKRRQLKRVEEQVYFLHQISLLRCSFYAFSDAWRRAVKARAIGVLARHIALRHPLRLWRQVTKQRLSDAQHTRTVLVQRFKRALLQWRQGVEQKQRVEFYLLWASKKRCATAIGIWVSWRAKQYELRRCADRIKLDHTSTLVRFLFSVWARAERMRRHCRMGATVLLTAVAFGPALRSWLTALQASLKDEQNKQSQYHKKLIRVRGLGCWRVALQQKRRNRVVSSISYDVAKARCVLNIRHCLLLWRATVAARRHERCCRVVLQRATQTLAPQRHILAAGPSPRENQISKWVTKADCSDIVPLDTATVVSFFYALSSPAREAIISRVQRCRSRIREAISLWTLRLRSRRLQERGQSLTRARQQRQVAHCFHLWHVELKSLVLERAVALSQNLRILHRSFYLWKQQQLTRARGRLAVSALNRFLSTRLVRRYWTVWSVQYAKQRQLLSMVRQYQQRYCTVQVITFLDIWRVWTLKHCREREIIKELKTTLAQRLLFAFLTLWSRNYLQRTHLRFLLGKCQQQLLTQLVLPVWRTLAEQAAQRDAVLEQRYVLFAKAKVAASLSAWRCIASLSARARFLQQHILKNVLLRKTFRYLSKRLCDASHVQQWMCRRSIRVWYAGANSQRALRSQADRIQQTNARCLLRTCFSGLWLETTAFVFHVRLRMAFCLAVFPYCSKASFSREHQNLTRSDWSVEGVYPKTLQTAPAPRSEETALPLVVYLEFGPFLASQRLTSQTGVPLVERITLCSATIPFHSHYQRLLNSGTTASLDAATFWCDTKKTSVVMEAPLRCVLAVDAYSTQRVMQRGLEQWIENVKRRKALRIMERRQFHAVEWRYEDRLLRRTLCAAARYTHEVREKRRVARKTVVISLKRRIISRVWEIWRLYYLALQVQLEEQAQRLTDTLRQRSKKRAASLYLAPTASSLPATEQWLCYFSFSKWISWTRALLQHVAAYAGKRQKAILCYWRFFTAQQQAVRQLRSTHLQQRYFDAWKQDVRRRLFATLCRDWIHTLLCRPSGLLDCLQLWRLHVFFQRRRKQRLQETLQYWRRDYCANRSRLKHTAFCVAERYQTQLVLRVFLVMQAKVLFILKERWFTATLTACIRRWTLRRVWDRLIYLSTTERDMYRILTEQAAAKREHLAKRQIFQQWKQWILAQRWLDEMNAATLQGLFLAWKMAACFSQRLGYWERRTRHDTLIRWMARVKEQKRYAEKHTERKRDAVRCVLNTWQASACQKRRLRTLALALSQNRTTQVLRSVFTIWKACYHRAYEAKRLRNIARYSEFAYRGFLKSESVLEQHNTVPPFVALQRAHCAELLKSAFRSLRKHMYVERLAQSTRHLQLEAVFGYWKNRVWMQRKRRQQQRATLLRWWRENVVLCRKRALRWVERERLVLALKQLLICRRAVRRWGRYYVPLCRARRACRQQRAEALLRRTLTVWRLQLRVSVYEKLKREKPQRKDCCALLDAVTRAFSATDVLSQDKFRHDAKHLALQHWVLWSYRLCWNRECDQRERLFRKATSHKASREAVRQWKRAVVALRSNAGRAETETQSFL